MLNWRDSRRLEEGFLDVRHSTSRDELTPRRPVEQEARCFYLIVTLCVLLCSNAPATSIEDFNDSSNQ
jgi:hypothetical protein